MVTVFSFASPFPKSFLLYCPVMQVSGALQGMFKMEKYFVRKQGTLKMLNAVSSCISRACSLVQPFWAWNNLSK